MQHSSHTCVYKANTPNTNLRARWKLLQLAWEKRRLESKLETILRSAQGHESNGLPAGNAQYRLLAAHAESSCRAFADRWEVDRDLLAAQIPGLCKLKALAQPKPKKPVSRLAFVLIIGAPLIFILMGIIGGLVSVGFHLVGGK